MFAGGSEFELMRQHVDETPPPLRTLRPDIPEALETLVLRLTAKRAEDRPQDAYDVYDQLLPFLPEPGSEPPPTAKLPVGVPDPTLLYRHPNAPRPRPETAPAIDPHDLSGQSHASDEAPATDLRGAIGAAVAHSDDLLNDERFSQAAEALQAVIEPAAAALGSENQRVLCLNSMPCTRPSSARKVPRATRRSSACRRRRTAERSSDRPRSRCGSSGRSSPTSVPAPATSLRLPLTCAGASGCCSLPRATSNWHSPT